VRKEHWSAHFVDPGFRSAELRGLGPVLSNDDDLRPFALAVARPPLLGKKTCGHWKNRCASAGAAFVACDWLVSFTSMSISFHEMSFSYQKRCDFGRQLGVGTCSASPPELAQRSKSGVTGHGPH